MDPLTLWALELIWQWSRAAAGLVALTAIVWYGYAYASTRRARR